MTRPLALLLLAISLACACYLLTRPGYPLLDWRLYAAIVGAAFGIQALIWGRWWS